MKLALVALLALGASAAAPSLSSCGKDGDHFTAKTLSISPDPPVKGQPITITMDGSLDQDITAGKVSINLTVVALGIIKQQVAQDVSFTMARTALTKGQQTFVVGPWSLPSNIPGSMELTGNIIAVTDKGEPLACIDIALEMPTVFDEAPPTPEVASAVDSCTTPQDHMSNIKNSTSGSTTTMSFTLDKDIAKATVDIDVTIQELFIKVPIKLSIPVSYTPGIKKGDTTMTFTTDSNQNLFAGLGLSVNGQVKAEDGNGEQITCLNIDAKGVSGEGSITV